MEKFKAEYGHMPNLIINGIGDVHGTVMIVTTHPFIFDNRQLPKTFLDIPVRDGTPDEEMPEEFRVLDNRVDYPWAYQRYEKFVDAHMDEIRRKLGKPDMNREEMLDALSPNGNFQEWITQCQKWEEDGIIPPYKEGDI